MFALGQISLMLCHVIVKNVTSTDHLRMLRMDCSGKKLDCPARTWLMSVSIIIIMHSIILDRVKWHANRLATTTNAEVQTTTLCILL